MTTTRDVESTPWCDGRAFVTLLGATRESCLAICRLR